jgi:hypothetical protein
VNIIPVSVAGNGMWPVFVRNGNFSSFRAAAFPFSLLSLKQLSGASSRL